MPTIPRRLPAAAGAGDCGNAADGPRETPAPAPEQTAPAQEAAPAPDAPVASTDRIPASGAAVSAWGIAVRDAEVLLQGGRRNTISAGTLFEEISTAGEGDDASAVGAVWDDGQWISPVSVRLTDLFRVPGTRGDVAADDVDFLRRFYTLKGRLAALEAESRAEAASRNGKKPTLTAAERAAIDANPYAEEYRALYRTQQEFEAKVEALVAERDNSTGAKRMKAADQLRSMQHEQQVLERKIKEIDKKYKAWKKAHPVVDSANSQDAVEAPDPAVDPRIEILRREVESMLPKARQYGAR
ncbi:MAG: hypothetical protein ACOX5G_00915 [Kiritimatiellia bacterium]